VSKIVILLLGAGVGASFVVKAVSYTKAFIEEGRSYRKTVERELIRRTSKEIESLPPLPCGDEVHEPAQIFRLLSYRYGVPPELFLLVIGVESGGKVNLYATSCDVCRSCGGLTSDRWRKNPKVREWIAWVERHRDTLSPYLSKGGKVINCNLPSSCWCNVGFGLTQIASFNLKNFPPPEGPKPYAPEEEHPLSPYSLCTNLEYGFKVLSRCLKKHPEDLGRAICCYNGINNTQYLERIKRYAKKLGVERSWKAKIVDFFDVSVQKIRQLWHRLKGESC